MKCLVNFGFLIVLLMGCQQSNQELYYQVMQVHDDVMPKMNDLYKAKTTILKQMQDSSLNESDQAKLAARLARIDSASEGMMVWMRQFNPTPDSAGEDKARAYLQSELTKIKSVRQEILTALEIPQ